MEPMIMKTASANEAWNKIPETVRPRLLSRIWCDSCLEFSAVDKYCCKIVSDDLVLCGNCKHCGHEISHPVPMITD